MLCLPPLPPPPLGWCLQQHPELHFAVAEVCSVLGLSELPELLLLAGAPAAPPPPLAPPTPSAASSRSDLVPCPWGPVVLLQLPTMSTAAMGQAGAADRDRQPPSGLGSWRRRAVLLLEPSALALAASDGGQGGGGPAAAQAGAGELAALIGRALAPMLMPGGCGCGCAAPRVPGHNWGSPEVCAGPSRHCIPDAIVRIL